jgi:hypothetical protein
MKFIGQIGFLAFSTCGQYMIMTKWSENNELRINALFEKMENEHRAEMLMRTQKHKTDMYRISQHIEMLEKSIK